MIPFNTANNDDIYRLLDDINASTLTNQQKFDANLKVYNKAIADGVDTDVLVVKDISWIDANGEPIWPEHGGFKLDADGNPIKMGTYPQTGKVFDRYGDASGRYVSPIDNGVSVDYDMRALPYVENPNAYHKYIVDQDFSTLQSVIDNCQDTVLKDSVEAYIKRYSVELKAHVGEIAPTFGTKTGGTQLQLPLPVKMLEALGMVREIQ